MKRSSLFALFYTLPLALLAQQAVFTDNFSNGSTTNKTSIPGGTPTASFTSYDMASTKTVTNSPPAGHLKIGLTGATGSGFYEAQAVFAASPVKLVTVGDFITLTYTFTNAGSLLAGGTTSYLYTGLYNSGGSVPVAGALAVAGLTTTPGSVYGSGNCANWQGYVSRISAGGNSEAYTRPAQTNVPTGGSSAGQDLVGNGIGGGAYTNLTGTVFDTAEVNSTLSLVTGSTYTLSYTIALTDVGTLTVTNNLFNGSSATGTPIFSQTNTATGTNVLVTSFDGLAIGVINKGTSLDPFIDLASVAVSASVFGSPGPSFNVTGGGAGCSGNGFVVGLNGSVSTNVYLLYTNGVYSGPTVAGTGSAITFGTQNVIATYTVVASNTVTANTGLMNGSAVISLFPAPTIVVQPAPVVVTSGGVGLFSVSASGSSVFYQWYRNGVGLANSGEFVGVTTSNLFIYPATSADVASYYCVVSNACGSVTISTTNSLSLDAAANLVWAGGNPNNNWDTATTLNFLKSSAPAVFHSGDNVTFDDTSGNTTVSVAGYVAPGVLTENSSQTYSFGNISGGIIAGPGSLVMSGAGTLTISNVNSYGGGTTINGGGILTPLNYGSLGTGVVTMASGTLELPVAGSATLGLTNNINVTGSSTLQYDQSGTYGAVIYGTVSGNPGTTLSIYNYNGNTATSRLRLYGAFTNNSSINLNSIGATVEVAPYNASGSQVYNGMISGYGRFAPRGTGNVVFNGANTFNDGTFGVILSGGNMGLGADSAASSPPTIDSSPVGTGILEIDSSLGNASIYAVGGARNVGNPVQYNSTTNNMILSLAGNLTLSGAFQIALSSDAYGTNRTLNVTNGALITLSGGISDYSSSQGGGITKTGGGVLCLNGASTYTGPTTNTAGSLMGTGSFAGPVVVVSNAVLGAGSPTTIGTLTVNNNLTLSGNVIFKVNKSASPANDEVVVSGALANTTAGTLTITNIGATAFAVGDKFTLFSEPVANGAAMAITGGGMNWTNNLAVDGSIQALSVAATTAAYPTNVSFHISGGLLTIGWPATHLGWIVQLQTNTMAAGLSTASNAWYDVTSTSAGTNYIVNINAKNPTVFVRLRHP